VESIVETAQRHGLDDPHICYDTYNIEAEALGMEVRFFEDKAPELVNRPLLKDKSDLKHLRPPNPGEDGRMPFVIEVLGEYQKLRLHPKLHPSMSFTAPFTLAARLRGVENFLMDTIQDPAFAHDLLSFVTEEVLKPWLKVLRKVNKLGRPLIGGADALASPPNLSIDSLKRFALNYLLKLRESFEEEAIVQNWWGESHTNPEELLKLKLIASPKIIIGQDPDVELLGSKIYKEFAQKHDLPLVLGIGAGFLMTATPQEVQERVRKYVKVGKEGGKFLLYLCNVGAITPPGNLDAAVEAVREYGTY
jgi:uroporphyrinogen decarboxylase